jgi:hypothetical protein
MSKETGVSYPRYFEVSCDCGWSSQAIAKPHESGRAVLKSLINSHKKRGHKLRYQERGNAFCSLGEPTWR